MNVQVFTNTEDIKAALPRLRAASVPGRSNDGIRLVVTYTAYQEPTQRAIQEAQPAREEGLDLHVYSGVLDRVFRNSRGELVFTVFVLERVRGDGHSHAYRSFNVAKGDVHQLVVMDGLSS